MVESPQLDGRVALVTGGSRGIGRAVASALLRHGARVAISGRNARTLDQAEAALDAGDRLLTVRADVGDEGDVNRMFDETIARFQGLDILVNNAAVAVMADVATLAPADWDAMIGTNLTGVFLCCRMAIPYLRQRGGGWIVNISSLASQNPFSGGAAYSATKAGLNAFSHALMQEVRQDDIRVTVVLPGSVNTGFGGREPEGTSWKLAPEDVAQTVVDLLGHPTRSLPSRVDLRPSKPAK
jgi:3-oxoacyl-[acyl-carrier protein] reductase